MTVVGRRNASRHREAIEREYGKPVEDVVADLRTGRLRLTYQQIAARLEVHRDTIRRWRQQPAPATAVEETEHVA